MVHHDEDGIRRAIGWKASDKIERPSPPWMEGMQSEGMRRNGRGRVCLHLLTSRTATDIEMYKTSKTGPLIRMLN